MKAKRRMKPAYYWSETGEVTEGIICLKCSWRIPFEDSEGFFSEAKKRFAQHRCEDFPPSSSAHFLTREEYVEWRKTWHP